MRLVLCACYLALTLCQWDFPVSAILLLLDHQMDSRPSTSAVSRSVSLEPMRFVTRETDRRRMPDSVSKPAVNTDPKASEVVQPHHGVFSSSSSSLSLFSPSPRPSLTSNYGVPETGWSDDSVDSWIPLSLSPRSNLEVQQKDQRAASRAESPTATTTTEHSVSTSSPVVAQDYPTPIEEPTTIAIEEPTTIAIEEPTKIAIEEPTTVAIEDPMTITIEEPTTVAIEEPTTIAIEEPTTVSIEEVLPATVEYKPAWSCIALFDSFHWDLAGPSSSIAEMALRELMRTCRGGQSESDRVQDGQLSQTRSWKHRINALDLLHKSYVDTLTPRQMVQVADCECNQEFGHTLVQSIVASGDEQSAVHAVTEVLWVSMLRDRAMTEIVDKQLNNVVHLAVLSQNPLMLQRVLQQSDKLRGVQETILLLVARNVNGKRPIDVVDEITPTVRPGMLSVLKKRYRLAELYLKPELAQHHHHRQHHHR